jgi:hypothetical protein
MAPPGPHPEEPSGTVTAVAGNGFYLQDPHPDADQATSEALFVFTSAAPAVGVVASIRGGSGGVGPDVGEHAAAVPAREGPYEP